MLCLLPHGEIPFLPLKSRSNHPLLSYLKSSFCYVLTYIPLPLPGWDVQHRTHPWNVGCSPTQSRLLGWWTPVIKHTDGLHTQCRPAMYGWMSRPDLWSDHPAGPTITWCSNSSSSPPPRFHLIKIRCSGPGVSTAYGTSPSKVAGGSPSGSTD